MCRFAYRTTNIFTVLPTAFVIVHWLTVEIGLCAPPLCFATKYHTSIKRDGIKWGKKDVSIRIGLITNRLFVRLSDFPASKWTRVGEWLE